MTYEILRSCVILICLVRVIVSVCFQGPYSNKCQIDSNFTETENIEPICECVDMIFCSIINYTEDCNSTIFHFATDKTPSIFTQIQCSASHSQTQLETTVEVLNSREDTLYVKINSESDFGMLKIFCTVLEPPDDDNKTLNTGWEVTDISPAHVVVDSAVKLQLTVNKDGNQTNSSPVWCFIFTPDNVTEVLSAELSSEDQITCSGFTPIISGRYTISLSPAFHSVETVPWVTVTEKRPVGQRAEYDLDFETIFIHFDSNIELHSDCGESFSRTSVTGFGKGFDCFVRGNTLGVRMGSEYQVLGNITIVSGNRICREGARSPEHCLSAAAGSLVLAQSEVSGPSLNFYIENACGDNKTPKRMSVRANANRRNPHHQTSTPSSGKPSGKSHRKNIIMWRTMRQLQSRLPSSLLIQFNETNALPLIEGLQAFAGLLGDGGSELGSGAAVDLHVESPPGRSAIMAEAEVRLCEGRDKLFRYKWTVNGQELSEDGRVIVLRVLPPGKYVVKCLVVDYNSGEALGQAWSATEVSERGEEILIAPSEMAVGPADDILLVAIISTGSPVSWKCKTASGDPCTTKQHNPITDFTSNSVSLPAGNLPVGRYIWTAESAGRVGSAKVWIQGGEARIGVGIGSDLAPSSEVILNGTVGRVEGTCRAGWSSVRRKGFNFIDLNSIGVKQVSIEDPQQELPLRISSQYRHLLQPDSLYLFKLQILCTPPAPPRYIQVPIHTPAVPHSFPVVLQPLKGKAMITTFDVSSPVSATDRPLIFFWNYLGPCDLELPIGHGLSKNFTSFLPPGDGRVLVRVCNERNLCTTSVSQTVEVIQSAEVHKENFERSIERVEHSMVSGDVSEAFGLAAVMLKSLALTAEFEIRGKIVSTVERAGMLKMKELQESLGGDPNGVTLCLEFCRRAERVVNYLREDSEFIKQLKKLKKIVLKKSKLK